MIVFLTKTVTLDSNLKLRKKRTMREGVEHVLTSEDRVNLIKKLNIVDFHLTKLK